MNIEVLDYKGPSSTKCLQFSTSFIFLLIQVKVWLLPEDENTGNLSNAVLELPTQDARIENVLWHPTAQGLLAVTCRSTVKLFDVNSAAEKSGIVYPMFFFLFFFCKIMTL